MSAVVDTNILIFDTFEDSEFHTEARKLLDSLETWILPSIVVHEYVWFMKGEGLDLGFSQEKVIEFLIHAKTTFVPTQVDDIFFSIQRIEEHRDYNDFLVLSAAKRTGHSLLTFDARLKRHAARYGVRTL